MKPGTPRRDALLRMRAQRCSFSTVDADAPAGIHIERRSCTGSALHHIVRPPGLRAHLCVA